MFGEQKTSGALIGLMRESNWTMRSIASVVILTFGGLVTLPAEAAIQQEVKQIQWHRQGASNAAKLSAKLEETHAALAKLTSFDTKKLDLSASHAQIHALKADLESLDKGAMDDFAANEAHIKAHKLPEILEQRQQEAVKTYRTRMDTLMAELNAADTAKDAAGFLAHVNNAKAHLDKVQVKPFHQKFDPKNLPFSVAKPTGVKPRLSKKDYQARPVAPPKRAQVAANGPLAGILTAADVTGSLPASPSDPSYVAATDDVQITPAIQAQAKALNNDPVQIYNWVHNNIEYIPTYGSIQGSDMTLQTLKGNDFDQASLLIALLRAANVPSRYVYGTIQVPISQVENWVGGVTDPNAALNLMSQGGIPATGLVQGGQIKYAQLEHVWVEAWINFVPSRAAKPGPGNLWVPMDASFKQYTYTNGTNLQSAVPFDFQGLLKHITSTSTIGSSSFANFDNSYLEQQLASYQQQIATFLQSQASLTSAQITGSKIINIQQQNNIDASLKYAVVSIGQRFTSISDELRWKFDFEIDDQYGNQVLAYSQPICDLVGKSIALSFNPTTSQDETTLNSFIPSVDSSGNSIDPSQFPDSIPGYLIDVTPVLTIDRQVVATGSESLQIGAPMNESKGVSNSWQQNSPTQSPLTAGQYQAVGLDAHGISANQINSLETNITNFYSSLPTSNQSFTRDDVTGYMLQLGIYSYFVANDNFDNIMARPGGMVNYRAPSFGTFSTVVNSVSDFGVPISVSSGGVLMDMGHMSNEGVATNGDNNTKVLFYETVGMRVSSYEQIVPQSLFSSIDPNAQGVSAVSALTAAAAAGQTIYTIDSTNAATILPLLNHSPEVLADIQDSVNSGEQVVISQTAVAVGGWTGAGYMIIDPSTGSGAYRIAGGANGGALNFLEKNFFTLLGIIGGVLDFFKAQVLKLAGKVLEGISIIKDLYDVVMNCYSDPLNLYMGLTLYLWLTGVTTILAIGLGGIIGLLVAALIMSVVTAVILERCEEG